jgi:AcrR family transcriptional regulator
MSRKTMQKASTCSSLLSALQAQLQEGDRLTVEAIALRAGVNKALVYRYFGGLPGLLSAFAASDAFMPDSSELLELCGIDLGRLSPRERFIRCIQAYVKALQVRPATVQILLRLPSLTVEIRQALAEGRARALEPIRELFGNEEIGPNFNRELAFNLLISGICVLLGAQQEGWNSPPMAMDELSSKILKMIDEMLLGEGRSV